MTIKIGINNNVFEATDDDLENILSIREAAKIEASLLEQKKIERAAVLEKLGITENEAELLAQFL